MMRSFLVYPTYCVFPNVLPTVSTIFWMPCYHLTSLCRTRFSCLMCFIEDRTISCRRRDWSSSGSCLWVRLCFVLGVGLRLIPLDRHLCLGMVSRIYCSFVSCISLLHTSKCSNWWCVTQIDGDICLLPIASEQRLGDSSVWWSFGERRFAALFPATELSS